MKNKAKLLAVALISLLVAAGLVLIGCEERVCRETGECTITINKKKEIDYSAPLYHCGMKGEYNYNSKKYKDGCQVADMAANEKNRKKDKSYHCNCGN